MAANEDGNGSKRARMDPPELKRSSSKPFADEEPGIQEAPTTRTTPVVEQSAPEIAGETRANHQPSPDLLPSCGFPVKSSGVSWAGRRPYNEDRLVMHTHCGALGSYYAVYDGHGGSLCCDLLVQNLHNNIRKAFRFESASEDPVLIEKLDALNTAAQQANTACDALIENPADEASTKAKEDADQALSTRKKELAEHHVADDHSIVTSAVRKALVEGFRTTDLEFLHTVRGRNLQAGSTAVSLLLFSWNGERYLSVAHVGDSRAVLARGERAVRLTEDHKPSMPEEVARLRKHGGHVVRGEDGVLRVGRPQAAIRINMTRAFGDAALKEPLGVITAEPTVAVVRLQPMDQAVVLACDGVFDVLDDAEVVRLALSNSDPHDAIVRNAMRLGSVDNLTALVIFIPGAETPPPAPEEIDMFS